MSLPVKNKFDPQFALNRGGPPEQMFRDYLAKLDALVTAMATGNLPVLGNYANDAAAAVGGVNVGQMYRNGSVVMVRVV